jgi:hypothetical protein
MIEEQRRPEPSRVERLHVDVPCVSDHVVPGFLGALDAIRREASGSTVSIALLCAESAGSQIVGRVWEYARPAPLPVTMIAGALTEDLNKVIQAWPTGADVLLLDPGVMISPGSVQCNERKSNFQSR